MSAVDYSKTRKRYFGLEQELGIKGNNSNTWGERENVYNKAKARKLDMYNVSVDCGCIEYVSNPVPLSSIVKGKRIPELQRFLGDMGLKPDSKGGTHLHISLKERDNKWTTNNALYLAAQFYEEFQAICGRKSNRWAQKPMSIGYQAKEKVNENIFNPAQAYSRYYWILTPTMHKTIEFRGPKGTRSINDIRAWAEFLDQIVRVSNQDSIEGVKFKDLIKGKHIEAKVDKLIKQGKIKEEIMEYQIGPDYKNKTFTERNIVCA